MRRILLVALMIMVCSCSLALAADVSPEFKVDQATPDYSVDRGVKDEIESFLNEKGYSEGLNSRDKGGDFFIATGSGTIQAARNSSAYMTSRINAYEKAMMAAKKQMVEFIGVEISKEVSSDYTEGEDPAVRKKKDAEALKQPSILDKTSALVHAKLDKLLEDEGVDLSKPVPQEAIQKAVTSEEFAKVTRAAASARIVGMQTMKVFEVSPDGSKGQIGVIAVYSDKLHMMANALFSGGATGIPSGTPKKPIIEQLPQDKLILLSTFGVQQKTDEKGRLVLVAFGEGVPKTASPRSLDAAYEKAKLEAMGSLRSFAGEIAAVETDMSEFESTKELEEGMEQYQNESYYKEKIKTSAAALKISGAAKISSWEIKHPLTNQKVVGVIVAWSPDSAAQAGKFGKKMASQPQKNSASAGQPRNGTYKSGSNQGGSFQSSGAEADADSF